MNKVKADNFFTRMWAESKRVAGVLPVWIIWMWAFVGVLNLLIGFAFVLSTVVGILNLIFGVVFVCFSIAGFVAKAERNNV